MNTKLNLPDPDGLVQVTCPLIKWVKLYPDGTFAVTPPLKRLLDLFYWEN